MSPLPPVALFRSLDPAELERFLQRHKASTLPGEVDLGLHLRQILEKACELVPSRSGAILLDDPLRKVDDRARNDLFVVAAFGPSAAVAPGERVRPGGGPLADVYRTGEPHVAATGDRPMVAAPITIGSTVCGVIELQGRPGEEPFHERDLTILQIFASYTSSTLQNALDAKRAHELARRDDLSGLYNDRWLHHRLVAFIEEADETREPCALIFMDLDGFKQVNDTHGHVVGSQVLREVGFLLRRTVQVGGGLLARYGGDEFVVALPATDLAAAAEVAEQVRAAVAGATFLERDHGAGVPALHLRGMVTASLGVAVYRPDAGVEGPVHLKESWLLRRADRAMYAAKAAGKNRLVVDA